jgi:deazaflavin-dependent oxidoreductase (nitroreductase family)
MSTDYEAFQRMLIADMRENGGRVTSGPMAGRTLGILTTTGARTGEPRISIVTWTREGDTYVIAATKGGAPTHPAWYHNLVANPDATFEAEGATIPVRATVAEGAERQRLWDEHAKEHPEFAGYPDKTDRVIPVIVLERRDQPASSAH